MDNDKKSLRRILLYLKPNQSTVFMAVLFSVLNSGVTILTTYIMKEIGDKLGNFQFDGFYNILYILGAFVVLGMILTYLEAYATSKYSTRFTEDIKNSITEHMIKLPISEVKQFHSGDLVSRLNNDVSVVSNLVGKIPHYLCQPVIFACAFIYMFIIDWKLLLACSILIPISSMLINKINKPMQRLSKQRMEAIAKSNADFTDMINGMQIVKAFSLRGEMTGKYKTAACNIEERSLRMDRIRAGYFPVFLALRFIPQLICPICGGYLMLKGEITTGGLIAFLMLIGYVFTPVEELLGFMNMLRAFVSEA